MHRAACFPESCLQGTSAKPGTNRIQSRVWQATASSHRRQSFQSLADSTAKSSLHPAFFTLSLRVLNLAVSNIWHLRLSCKREGPRIHAGLGLPSIDSSLPDFVAL